MKDIFLGMLALAGVLIGIVLFALFSFHMYQYFAPKYEAVRRDVFINTPSYNIGKEQERRKIEREMQRDIENQAILENVLDHVK